MSEDKAPESGEKGSEKAARGAYAKVPVEPSISPHVREHVQRLTLTGLFGPTESDVIDRLLSRAIVDLIAAGVLKTFDKEKDERICTDSRPKKDAPKP